ncbi:MAG: hypothetical protein U0263_20165 [Polyangiaceae bacterium]
MNTTNITLALILGIALTGCGANDGERNARGKSFEVIACQTDADCGAGSHCEAEDTGSFCKAHGGADDGTAGAAGSGAGGSGAGGAGGNDDPSIGGGGSATACTTDADCAAGEQCEVEDTGSFCMPDGGAGTGGSSGASAGAGGSGAGGSGSGGSGSGGSGSGGSSSGGSSSGGSSSGGSSAGGSSGSGGSATGTSQCTTDADCPVGQQCELEGAVTTCKVHGSGKGGGSGK